MSRRTQVGKSVVIRGDYRLISVCPRGSNMPIRYECPQASIEGAYMLLDLETRTGTGYYSGGNVRWGPREISTREEQGNIQCGIWVNRIPPDQRLPPGF